VELQRLTFKLVGVTTAIGRLGASSGTLESHGGGNIKQDGQVRREPTRCPARQAADLVERQFTARALIRHRRVDVTIREYDVTPIQGRLDDRGDVMGPVCCEEQRLGPWRERLVVM
jgi:hypothetical protein